jgi:hypothetical protein
MLDLFYRTTTLGTLLPPPRALPGEHISLDAKPPEMGFLNSNPEWAEVEKTVEQSGRSAGPEVQVPRKPATVCQV